MDIQHIVLLGRATKDAEKVETKKDKKFAKFNLAVNEYNAITKEEVSYYYTVLVFANNVDKVIDIIKKGDTILVNGKPHIDVYISKKDNMAKGSIIVLAESWKVLKVFED